MKPVQYFLFFLGTVMLAALLEPWPTLAQEEPTCASDYTVQAGDFLTQVAADMLDDSKLYPAIIAATNTKAAADSSYHIIGQEGNIQAGWKLCIPSAADASGLLGSAAVAAGSSNTLTVDALANATYSGIYDTPVTLTDGMYEGEPFSADSPERPRVILINKGIFSGDLNGDGVEDAVLFLEENSGGTGHFIYIAAQLNQNGQPLDAGTVLIEDRIQVIAVAIESGQIKLEVTAEGPGDAACCKSHKTHKAYALQDGKLAEVAGPEEPLEKISAADLNGITWTLVDLNFDQQPALADAPVTISFQDGQISGSGGCNSYNSSFTPGEDNPFVITINPVVATKKACPDPILNQETAYFTALEHASQWDYLMGNLAISYDDGQGGLGTLVFTPQTAPPDLTTEQLKNATYSGIYEDAPVTLTDGKYEGEPFSADSPLRPTVTLLDNGIIFGDLNGDGADDAVVFLVENSGGTGQFVYASAQLNQNGQPLDAGIVAMGDRVAIKSAAIENNQVVAEIVTQGPGDGACCPTLKVRVIYALQAGVLAEVGGEELGKISADDLNGTTWILVDLNFDQQPALADTPVTISFQDGQVSGSGGCNSYTGGFTLSEDNPFVMTIGPVAATKLACPDPILSQETTYFGALEKASQWGYRVGRLAIYYVNDQNDFGTLLFAPPIAETPPTEVISFVPPEIPTETKAGSCFANAIGLGRAEAWRCTVGNGIYDPCFAVGDTPTVVCGANPSTGATGFVLQLTEALPAPDPGNLSQPWLIELADGQVCGLQTGTVPGVGDRVAPYGCPDGSNLFDDFQQGQVWLAEKAVIGLNDNGFFIEQSEMVPLRRVWR